MALDQDKITFLDTHLESGEVIHGEPDIDQLEEADQIFYSIETRGETFYRYVAGPFDDIEDVYTAIEDDEDFYAEAS